MNRLVSFWLLVAIIVAVSLLFYQVMAGFLLPLFLASLLVVLFEPAHRRVAQWIGPRPKLAAGISTAIVVGCIFLPVLWTGSLAVSQSVAIVRRFDVRETSRQLHKLRDMLALDVPMYEEVVDLAPLYRDLCEPTPPDRAATIGEITARLTAIADQFPVHVPDDGRDDQGQLRAGLAQVREKLRQVSLVMASEEQLAAGSASSGAAPRETAAHEARQAFVEWSEQLPRGVVRLTAKRTLHPTPEKLHEWRVSATESAQAWLLPAANATAGFVFQAVFGVIIMVVSVFFFFLDGPEMVATIMRLIPLDVRHQRELLDDFVGISRAVVMATLVSALGQGVLAAAGFWLANVDSVALLVLLTIVFAMIPFVGAMAVWIPVCVWLGLVEGRLGASLGLAAYCAVIVSQADNVIKPMMLRGHSNLHPLLALLSILGGVKALGPIGILVGPMVVVFLQTLLKILQREMTSMGAEGKRPRNLPQSQEDIANSAPPSPVGD